MKALGWMGWAATAAVVTAACGWVDPGTETRGVAADAADGGAGGGPNAGSAGATQSGGSTGGGAGRAGPAGTAGTTGEAGAAGAGSTAMGGAGGAGSAGTTTNHCVGQADGDHCGTDLGPASDAKSLYRCESGTTQSTVKCASQCDATNHACAGGDVGTGPAAASRRLAASACDFYAADACGDCADTACCDVESACFASPACFGLWNCLAACPTGDTACSGACLAANPSGELGVRAIYACTGSKCTQACKTTCDWWPHPTNPCEACSDAKCCAEESRCFWDSDCAGLLECYAPCGKATNVMDSELCMLACLKIFPKGREIYESFRACQDGKCTSEDECDVSCTWYDNTPCGNCVDGNCCSAVSTCMWKRDCHDLNDCVSACADDACRQDCYQAHPDSIADFEALQACTNTKCSTLCP